MIYYDLLLKTFKIGSEYGVHCLIYFKFKHKNKTLKNVISDFRSIYD